ncbi:MAG: DUF4157 domain-containing protein [Thiohalocapsa sp. PB-PSB1]|nr:MAG: DUF4157 domain-containing protein [Thiohalocapsa sp. PB-PSB1]
MSKQKQKRSNQSSPTARPVPQRKKSREQASGEIGNMLRQYQLRVTPANDQYESEADEMARRVAAMPENQAHQQETALAEQVTPLVQRQEAPAEEEEAQAKRIQRQEESEEEEEMQAKRIQRQKEGEEEEEMQAKRVQRQEEGEEEEEMQAKHVQRQAVGEEEEEMQAKRIQRQEEGEKEEEMQAKRIQRQEEGEEEEEVQAKRIQRQEEHEEGEDLQTSGTQLDNGGRVSPKMEERIRQLMQGGGRPLDKETREHFEPRFGADFSQVRVHDDAEAAQIAGQMNSRAFTQGSHIFFGRGQYQPQTSAGRDLLAHELTHTIQQGAVPATGKQKRVQRDVIQRNDNVTPGPGSSWSAQIINDTILFDSITVPDFKVSAPHRSGLYSGYGQHGGRMRRNRAYNDDTRPRNQRDLWRQRINTGLIRDRIIYAIRRDQTGEVLQVRDPNFDPVDLSRRYVLTIDPHDRPRLYFFGTIDELALSMTTPSWGNDRARPPYKAMQVDHIAELQIANYPDSAAQTHGMQNFELLEESINRSSGGVILNSVNSNVDEFNQATDYEYVDGNEGIQDSRRLLKSHFHLEFEDVDSDGTSTATDDDYWVRDDIAAAEHLQNIEVTSFENIGGYGNILLFSSAEGGLPVTVNISGEISPTLRARLGVKYFPITNKSFDETELNAENINTNNRVGILTVTIPDPIDANPPEREVIVTMPVRRISGARYGAYIDWNNFRQRVNTLGEAVQVEELSPLQINTLDLTDEGVYIAGKIITDIPLLGDADIDFTLLGDNLTVSKSFSTGELNAPPPLNIDNSSLTIAISTQEGLSGSGRIDFSIERLGQGYLAAEARTGRGQTQGGFSVTGSFDFDAQLFDPARVDIWYRNNQLGARGTIGIPSGRINGIRSAEFTIGYENDTITASGTAQFAAPGIQNAGLNLTYSEEEGLTIGGTLQLGEVPGLRGGSLEAEIQRKPDGSYKVSASGTAQPAIPGINSQVSLSYDDGIFDANVTASYSRGMLSGELTLGATNRPVDPESNQPTGDPEPSNVRAYGGGQVTVQLAPWLQGTVGIKLLPNAEIELRGEIGLPNAVDLFPRRSVEKNIFTINIDIPIVGVAVAGQRIGIFATIGGGVDVSAGFGPGQLRELSLGITYNPDHEDQTHVTGRGQLHVPADAGLRLFVRGGLGAGIPIVSATAGLEVSGELGLQGALEANVNVDWMPSAGLEIDANAGIFVEPRLRLSVDAYVDVSADLLLTTVELYSERWNLAGVEYGSGLRFGINFPIHYKEGEPFDVSLDDVEFTVPDIDARSLITGVLEQF